MAKLVIDLSGTKGLARKYYGDDDQLTSSPNRRYNAQDGEVVDGFFNPFLRDGYLSPARATVTDLTFTGTLNATLKSCIYDAVNSDFYFAEYGQQLWKGDGLDDTDMSLAVDLGAGGTPTIHDLEIYQINGTRKIFLVYETGGNLEVGISALPYDSATDTPAWLSASATGGFTNTLSSGYAFMRVADNGFAYLFQDNYVHKIDGTSNGGTNGTVTANVLIFPGFFKLTDAVDYRGNMFIVVHQTTISPTSVQASENYSTPCGIYIWDRRTTTTQTRDYIPIEGIRTIQKIYIAPNGKLRILCLSSNGISQIREFNGSTFATIQEMGLGAYPQFPDGLTVYDDMTIWLGVDGTIYCHGGENDALAKITYVKAPSSSPYSNTTPGAILIGGSNSFSGTAGYRTDRKGITVGYHNGTANKLSRIYPFDTGTINSVNQTNLQGDIYYPLKLLPGLSTVSRIIVNCMTGTTSGTDTEATLKIYFNGSSTAWASKTITRNDIVKGYKEIEVNKQYINSIQIEIEYATSVTQSDAYTFHPMFAVVEYELTTTLK